MIKANELRIGNWLLETCEPIMVYQIDFGGISFYTINDIHYNRKTGCTLNGGEDRLQGIPITPEILEAAGFVWETEKKKHLQLYLPEQGIDERRISLYYNNGICEALQMYMSDYFNGCFETLPPKYVHQLQNSYFALTGEELEIKLDVIT